MIFRKITNRGKTPKLLEGYGKKMFFEQHIAAKTRTRRRNRQLRTSRPLPPPTSSRLARGNQNILLNKHRIRTENKLKPTQIAKDDTLSEYHAMLLALEAKTKELKSNRKSCNDHGKAGEWAGADAAAKACCEILSVCSKVKSPIQDALLTTIPFINKLLFVPSEKGDDDPAHNEEPNYTKYLDEYNASLASKLNRKEQYLETYYRSHHIKSRCKHDIGCQIDAPAMESPNQGLEKVSREISDTSEAGMVPLQVFEQVKLELVQLKRELLTNQRENQNIPALEKLREKIEEQQYNAQFYIPGQSQIGQPSCESNKIAGSTISSDSTSKMDPESMTMRDWEERKAKRQALLLENLSSKKNLG